MMPRITPVEGPRAPLLLRVLNRAARRMVGQDMMPLKVIAHNASFLLPYAMMSRFTQGKSQVQQETRLLATYLVAFRNGCPWCLDIGRYHAQEYDGLNDKLMDIDRYTESPLFSAPERAALAYADEMTRVGGWVSNETFAAIKEHFSEQEIVELTVAVATENFYNRINAALEIEAQGFCSMSAQPSRVTT